MSKLVTIYGGSGFVGRYIARRMARAGWRVRVAVRRPNEALFVRTYGVVGQVDPVLCNIRDDDSVTAALSGADAVVNCVGILASAGRNTFEAVHADGAARIARKAAEAGIARMVHVSAINANANAASAYARTKAEGEAAIRTYLPQAVILRPSVIFGPEDRFFNRFAAMALIGPVLPLVGAQTRFQPVYVDDVASAAERTLVAPDPVPDVYELGGPRVACFRDLMQDMLKIIRRRRLILDIPFWAAGPMALGFEVSEKLSLGLVPAQITRDQLRSLRHDNVASADMPGFAALGIKPTAMEVVLPGYLWRYRPSGQYDAIKESVRNLRV